MDSLVVPWILQELAELSITLCAGLFAVGLLLYLLGGYGHQFWLVLGTTLAAGILGLQYGPQFGMQRLVAGLFLGIAAGAIAQAVVRIAIFVGVGALVWYLAALIAPGWNEQLACFLVGGLLGVLLFRVWIMVLTSLLGTLLMTYAALLLIHRFSGADVAGLAERNGPLFNWAVGGVALLGLIFQTLILRGRWGGSSGGSSDKQEKKDRKPREEKKDRDGDRNSGDRGEGGWSLFHLLGKKAS